MKTIKRIPLFVALTTLFGAVVVFGPAADAQTIHALLVTMDGDARRGMEFEKSKTRVNYLMRTIKDELGCPVNKHVLSSSSEESEPEHHPTGSNILKWLIDVRPGPDDVVFVYFCGSGGATQNRELYLILIEEHLQRKLIVELMNRIPCRLKILITDACSFGGASVKVGAVPTLESALRDLFFEHKGFLNVAGAAIGELSVGDPTNGTGFTHSLIYGILDNYGDTDRNPEDGFVSWQEVFEYVRTETMNLFENNFGSFDQTSKDMMEEVGQTTQTPIYFGQLPERIHR